MRILHVCKYFFPRITGVTAYVENLGREQLARGHQVGVASWGEPGDAQDHKGIELLRAKAGDKKGLAGLIAGFRPDVIHAHSIWETTSLAVKAARNLGRPYVVTTHGTWQFLKYTGAYDRLADKLRLGVWRRHVAWPRMLRGAGAVIALNALEVVDARDARVANARVHRIPNAVDVGAFSPGDRGEARRSLGWPEGATVLFVGAMQAQKGLFTTLEAARMTDPELVGHWVFCGEGPELGKAKAEAEAMGLGGRAVFLGRVAREDMPALYRAADMVALPSRQEPFATVFLEAMASGIPCIGSDDGGTPEIIADSETGFLVPPDDPRALADMAGWLAKHPDEAASMGRAGRERAEREFAWPRVAERIEGAYRSALGTALALLVLLSCLAFAQSARAASVVPLDILTMIDPKTGGAVAEPGQKAAPEDWRRSNPVWDGRVARLRAAGGETASLQLVLLTDPGETLKDVRVQVSLPGSAKWRAYRVWHIWNVPEVAAPLGQGNPPFDIPSAVPAERDATKGFRAWTTVVEVEVPRRSLGAHLAGEARVAWQGGEARIPLEVDVEPFALPERPFFVVEMNSYGDYLRHLPPTPEAFVAIHKLFREFRCTFTLVPYRQAGTPVLDFLQPAMRPDGTLDFGRFDAALSGLFDGSSFPDGQPVSHFILPLRANWPAPLGSPEFEALNVAARKEFIRHVEDKGWNATRFQEFHNENPEAGAKVPWRMDEPLTAKDLAGHELFLSLRAKACGQSGQACPLRYRIDISRWQPLRQDLERMARNVTDWSVSAAPEFLDREAVGFFRRLGGQWLLAYGELPGFESGGKVTPWSAFPARLASLRLAGVDGFAQWQSDRWLDKPLPGIPPEESVLFQANAAGARDFMWPGPALGLAGPMPSMRLFAVREGVNLLDYYALAVKRRPELADRLLRKLAGLGGAAGEYAVKNELAAIAAGGDGHASGD